LNGIDCKKIDFINRDCFHLGIEKKFNWKRLLLDSKIAIEEYASIIKIEEDSKDISIYKIRDHIEDYIKLDLKNKRLSTHICFRNNVNNLIIK
jgi:hypothetical protein